MTAPYSIFFDLETSDLSPLGQIMNFCFTLVNPNYETVDECKGRVRLTRTQLPSARAILANRIDVREHQAHAEFSEVQAMRAIAGFVNKATGTYGDYNVALVGYNSAKFDLDRLRTSMIRNGVNPYFKVQYRDLLLLSRKLAACETEFPRTQSATDPAQRCLRLETLTKKFGLLEGPQAHESSADVALTISLARYFYEHFDTDVRTWCAYEPLLLARPEKGMALERLSPNYDLNADSNAVAAPFVLLDFNRRYALWIDLDRFDECRAAGEDPQKSVRWFKADGHDFFSDLHALKSPEILSRAAAACEALRGLNLNNYFKETDCDIEANIYRLDFQQRDGLQAFIDAFPRGDSRTLEGDARKLSVRFRINNSPDGTDKLDAALAKYALARYGGQVKTSKFDDAEYEEGVLLEGFHPTFVEMLDDLRTLRKTGSREDQALLDSLERYYFDSDLFRVAGRELQAMERRIPRGMNLGR